MSTAVNILRRIVFPDEFVFNVSGIMNTQNTRIRSAGYPQAMQDHAKNSPK